MRVKLSFPTLNGCMADRNTACQGSDLGRGKFWLFGSFSAAVVSSINLVADGSIFCPQGQEQVVVPVLSGSKSTLSF